MPEERRLYQREGREGDGGERGKRGRGRREREEGEGEGRGRGRGKREREREEREREEREGEGEGEGCGKCDISQSQRQRKEGRKGSRMCDYWRVRSWDTGCRHGGRPSGEEERDMKREGRSWKPHYRRSAQKLLASSWVH